MITSAISQWLWRPLLSLAKVRRLLPELPFVDAASHALLSLQVLQPRAKGSLQQLLKPQRRTVVAGSTASSGSPTAAVVAAAAASAAAATPQQSSSSAAVKGTGSARLKERMLAK